MSRLGVMGGTFDPIHQGHLVTAEEARAQFRLDGVIFVPNRHPPHKNPADVTNPEDRYLMTFLATAPNAHFSVSRTEIDRPGASYTIDTIRALSAQHRAAELYYITGADAILQIMRGEWERSAELLGMCQFIAATRPGFVLDLDTLRWRNCTGGTLDNVHKMEIPAMAISSTDIRTRVRTGRPIKYLVPEAVEAYIAKHSLYGWPASSESAASG
ncbi:MAG: nicotinate-nucleotide adenylyltransferase [bacterium]